MLGAITFLSNGFGPPSSVPPALTTAAIVHGRSTDHDRRRGQRCTVLARPVSLIHRGMSVQINRATSWVAGLIARRPYSVVIAAIANKLARTIWAVLATGKRYDGAAFAAAI